MWRGRSRVFFQAATALTGVAARLRRAVVGLVVAELLVGAVGATLIRRSRFRALWAVRFGVEFAFLGAAAVAFTAGHVFAARVGGVAGYRAFVGAGRLAAYARSLFTGFGTVGGVRGLLVVFHSFGLVGR